MSGGMTDPNGKSSDQKLDFLMDAMNRVLGQLTTMNGRLDSHDQRLAQVETEPTGGVQLEDITEIDDNDVPPNHGGRNSTNGGRSGARRCRGDDGDFYGRHDRYVGPKGYGRGGGRARDEEGAIRPPRPNFPSFDGESDPLTWINKCNTYFRGMRTLAEEKVWIASLHMEGVAAEWYYALERDHDILSWARFVDFVHMRFGPPLRTNGLAELKALYRTGTVEEYQRQFSLLLCRCDDLSPSQQVNMFTAGLGESLRTDVELLTPTNLQTAMSLARAYERRAEAVSVLKTAAASRIPGLGAKTMTPPRPRFKRLTPAELAAKRASGECYHCPEKYSADHKCSSKGVFLLEMEDNEDEETALVDLGISLHALTGIDVNNTMKLHVAVQGLTLVALVDTGSTHTFIQEAVASRLGIQVDPRPGLSVKVANGDRVTSSGVYPKLRLTIDDEAFDVTCFGLPLVGFDIVLGVQWLRSLGPILWNFSTLSMEFWRHGRTVRWTGVGAPTPQCAALTEP
jgi:hypothetical protein